MSVTLTTNGIIIATQARHHCLGQCLEACVKHGPIVMWQESMGWTARNVQQSGIVGIPSRMIESVYRVVRDPHCMFPDNGVVYVLNQQPTLVSPPVCDWDQPDPPGGEG